MTSRQPSTTSRSTRHVRSSASAPAGGTAAASPPSHACGISASVPGASPVPPPPAELVALGERRAPGRPQRLLRGLDDAACAKVSAPSGGWPRLDPSCTGAGLIPRLPLCVLASDSVVALCALMSEPEELDEVLRGPPATRGWW